MICGIAAGAAFSARSAFIARIIALLAFMDLQLVGYCGPVAEIRGNLLHIPHGSVFTEVARCTDFGKAVTSGEQTDISFIIHNIGDANLHITGPITFGGAAPTHFSVVSQLTPATDILPDPAFGSAYLFVLRFDPSSTGMKSATVNMPTDDPNRNPYTFAVRGEGVSNASAPEADLAVFDMIPKLKCNNQGKCRLRGKMTLVNLGNIDLEGGSVRVYGGQQDEFDLGDLLEIVPIAKRIKMGPSQQPFKITKVKYRIDVQNPTFDRVSAIVLPPNGVAENDPMDNLSIKTLAP